MKTASFVCLVTKRFFRSKWVKRLKTTLTRMTVSWRADRNLQFWAYFSLAYFSFSKANATRFLERLLIRSTVSGLLNWDWPFTVITSRSVNRSIYRRWVTSGDIPRWFQDCGMLQIRQIFVSWAVIHAERESFSHCAVRIINQFELNYFTTFVNRSASIRNEIRSEPLSFYKKFLVF